MNENKKRQTLVWRFCQQSRTVHRHIHYSWMAIIFARARLRGFNKQALFVFKVTADNNNKVD